MAFMLLCKKIQIVYSLKDSFDVYWNSKKYLHTVSKKKGDGKLRSLQIMQSIKSQMLDLWIENAKKPLTAVEYLELFKGIMSKEFNINKVEYLSIENDVLYPLSTSSDGYYISNGIPFLLVEPYLNQRHHFPNRLVNTLKHYFDYAGDVLILKDNCDKENCDKIGMIILEESSLWNSFAQTPFVDELENLLRDTVKMIKITQNIIYEKKLSQELFEMTEVFHSTMDVDHILEAMIHGVKRIFPKFPSKLILSNDQDRIKIEDVYVFDYLLERPSTIEAFVSGEMTIEHATDINNRLLNAPIKGKQGIYGVLQIFAPTEYRYSSREKRFIQHLTKTSGNALENAKLYHQSHRLVSDLQMINETSQRLNMKLNKEEILSFLTKQLKRSFEPSEICFALLNEDEFQNANGTTAFFYRKESKIYCDYISNHFSNSVDPLFVAEFDSLVEEKIPYNSMMVVPIIVREKVQGYCAILHQDSYYFSFDSFKLMQSLIRHSSLAISNILLREQLQEMVDRDHLTKLYAREYLERYIESSMSEDNCGTFVLLDIDNFKMVNDTFGHQMGDLILQSIGEQLQLCIQDEGICARWGGEEMAIYLPSKKANETVEIVNHIINLIPSVTEPSVTLSSGISEWHNDFKLSYKRLFQNADVALYKAKNSGKNRYCLFSSEYSKEK
ncbi:sensor domain-containing diguanylate cyclase [Rummeliibacillus sp. POC4]|nr:sensor domain-containing diguanylate cyclase [Rummeliibacillus sp. POC4]